MISVIIPTYRRPALVCRAVISVLQQTYRAIEVVVVIDGVDDGTRAAVEGLGDSRTRVIETGTNAGPAMARNVGVQHARGEYIALLDDDDEWRAEKLETQMRFIQQHQLTGEFLVSCRVIGRPAKGGSHIWPAALFASGDLGQYLLDRRTPFRRPGMACSGTLLFPRTVALRVPFAHDDVHEDWSWLLLCVTGHSIPLRMCPEPLFIYHLQPDSRNQRTAWRASLDWGRKYRPWMNGAAFAGLLSSTTAWRAKRNGDWRSFVEIARVLWRESDAQPRHWFTLFSIFLLPCGLAERLRQHALAHQRRRLAREVG